MTQQGPRTPRLSIKGLQSALAGPFDLDLAAGECAAVTGPSGSGKSLFLRMIADLDVSEGEISLDGKVRESFTAPQWRRCVTYVAAEAGWWAENVKTHFAAQDLPRAKALIRHLGLTPELFDGPVSRLSTGERQRLAIIRATLLAPPVLLLDEPTGSLDQGSTGKVEVLIRELLANGQSVLMVTHDGELGQRLATSHYQMAQRRLSLE